MPRCILSARSACPRPCSPRAAPSTSPSTRRATCASSTPRRSAPQEAARVEVPFELDDEIRGSLKQLPPLSSELRRINQVNDFIFDGLQLEYTLAPTKNAVETFRTRSGNCLSFVNLFVGVARELGLTPYYVEVPTSRSGTTASSPPPEQPCR